MSQHTSTHTHRGHSTPDLVSDVTNVAKETIIDTASKAKDHAQSVAQTAVDTTDQNRGTAARVLADAASTIHDSAAGLPGGERVTHLADAAADHLDAAADYVQHHTTSQMAADLRHIVKRYPGTSMLIAATAGLLVGRGLRKR